GIVGDGGVREGQRAAVDAEAAGAFRVGGNVVTDRGIADSNGAGFAVDAGRDLALRGGVGVDGTGHDGERAVVVDAARGAVRGRTRAGGRMIVLQDDAL